MSGVPAGDRPPHPVVALVSGVGRYSDPWHPFAQTSAAMAQILDEAGCSVTVTEDADERLGDLADVDLLVLNIGNPKTVEPQDARVRAGLTGFVARGGPILALHVSATSFPGVPEWEGILGGIWVRGTTMHPPLDLARIRVFPQRHEIVRGMADFEVEDERYSYLRVSPSVTVLADHRFEGHDHPVVWLHEPAGARVVYDALGHDTRSFASPEHRLLLQRAAGWLLHRPAENE